MELIDAKNISKISWNCRFKVRNMKIFDCLNSEKPTPMFLNLARRGSASKIIIKFNYLSSKVRENNKKEKEANIKKEKEANIKKVQE
jgi:hypothetical protein